MLNISATFRPRGDIGRFIAVKITPAVRKSVEEVAQMIQARAQELCPVDTGALRDSITVEVEDLNKTIRANVGPHMPYAEYLEFGTGIAGAASAGAGPYPYDPNWPGMVAQPFMRPSYEETKPKVEGLFRNNIAEAIEL